MALLFPPPPNVAKDTYQLWQYDGEKWGPRSLSWPGNRNILHNGQGLVNQIPGTGSGVAMGDWNYFCDRWLGWTKVAGAKITMQVAWLMGTASAPVPPSQTALSFTSAASAYTPAAADQFTLWQGIEFSDMACLMQGTPRAFPMTLSFWAWASFAGTYSGTFQNNGTGPSNPNRTYAFTFTLPATSWTYVIITIPGDTTSTGWDQPNFYDPGLWLTFDLGSGASRRIAPGAWTNTISTSAPTGATGAVQLTAGANRQLQLTNIQLELGSAATPYDQRPYAVEMAIAQRYHQVYKEIMCFNGWADPGAGIYQPFTTTAIMRVTPSGTISNIKNVSNCTSQTVSVNDSTSFVLRATATNAGVAYFNADIALAAEP